MKIVINKCFGGFSLSNAAYLRLIELGIPVVPMDNEEHGLTIADAEHPESEPSAKRWKSLSGSQYHAAWTRDDKHRSHPLVVQVVEELGDAASGQCAKLRVVEIPDDADFEIDEYDGNERVRERSRTWG